MRITPVGLIMPTDDLEALVDLVVEASRVTHHTGVAIAGAAAVAAAVAAASAERLSLKLRRSASEQPSWVSGGANGLLAR